MKTVTCKDLGGPCDAPLTGETFAEVGTKSMNHVKEQMEKGDEAHTAAVNAMMKATPDEQKAMMVEYEKNFNDAPSM